MQHNISSLFLERWLVSSCSFLEKSEALKRFLFNFFVGCDFRFLCHTPLVKKTKRQKRVSTGHWLPKAEEHFCCEMRELLLQPISCLDVASAADNSWGDNNVETVGVKLDDILLVFF